MNQKIKISQGIQYVIVAISLIVFFLIWPAGIIENTHTSKSGEVILRESDPISVANNGTQMFIAEGSCLKKVELYVANDMRGEIITFRLYDGAYQQLWETFHTVDDREKFPGFITILVDFEMEEGWEYYYTVEGLTTNLVLYYEDTNESSSYANGTLLYGGEEMPGINLIARYRYGEPFSWWMILILGLLLAVLALAGWKLTEKLFLKKWPQRNKEITVQKVLQWTLNPLVAVLTLMALLTVFPGRAFGTGIINYGFYYLGILITAAVILFGINYKRQGQEPFLTLKTIQTGWSGWAMSICFAGALWACYEYMNGLYNIHHSYATCKLLIWFSLALIFTFDFNRQGLLTIYNLIFLVAAGIGGYFYAKPYKGVEELEELYRLQAWVIVFGGFALLQIIVSLIKILRKKQKVTARLYLPYTACLMLMLGLMIIFRNTRTWPVLLAVVFGLFYFRMWMWEKRDRLLSIFSNGVILHFIYMVNYCLLHRPYLRFRHNRYGMAYHTVTMTGYYLALVLCAVVVRLFVRYGKTKRWQDTWKELSLLGVGNVYLFLTLSRTGYLAALVMEIFMVIFMAFVWEKKKPRWILQTLGLMAGISVLLFPAVFTAQRIMPAVYDDPVYSEIEVWEYTTEKGTPKNSELYIDPEAFIQIMKSKLFGMEMGNLSLSRLRDGLAPVYLRSQEVLLASTGPMEEEEDFSNGRIEIFREYIGQLNAVGHDKMGFAFPDGSISAHAHNTYLQVAYDHGIITGAVFGLFGIFTFLLGAFRYKREKENYPYLVLIPAITIAFGAAGMVEWIYHLCNLFGFSLMVVIAPLLFKPGKPNINGEEHEKAGV